VVFCHLPPSSGFPSLPGLIFAHHPEWGLRCRCLSLSLLPSSSGAFPVTSLWWSFVRPPLFFCWRAFSAPSRLTLVLPRIGWGWRAVPSSPPPLSFGLFRARLQVVLLTSLPSSASFPVAALPGNLSALLAAHSPSCLLLSATLFRRRAVWSTHWPACRSYGSQALFLSHWPSL